MQLSTELWYQVLPTKEARRLCKLIRCFHQSGINVKSRYFNNFMMIRKQFLSIISSGSPLQLLSDDSLSNDSSHSDCDEIDAGDLMYALDPFRAPKRKRIRRKVPIPRLLNMDIRRHYMTMFTNATNSHDPVLLCNFFKQYFAPDSKMSKPIPNTDETVPPLQLTVRGISSLIEYWAALMTMIPDHCTEAKNIRIIRRPNTGACRITCDLYMSLTQLYDPTDSFENMCDVSNPDTIEVVRGSVAKRPRVESLDQKDSEAGKEREQGAKTISQSMSAVAALHEQAKTNSKLQELLESTTKIHRAFDKRARDADENEADSTVAAYLMNCSKSHDSLLNVIKSPSGAQSAPSVAHGPLHLRLLSKPLSVTVAMSMTMYVNERHQIAGIEYSQASSVTLQ